MAEDENVMIEADSISLEDTEDSVTEDVDVTSIIPYIQDRYKRAEDYSCLLYTSPSPRDS